MKDKKQFTAIGRKWWDRVNGNTYHSVRITRHKDGAVLACQFQYGYGDQYQQTALDAMAKAGWLGKDVGRDARTTSGVSKYYRWERENGYPIIWTCAKCTKNECRAHGMQPAEATA